MSFSQLLGQPRVSAALLRALKLERVAHAYLFVGADGVGRRTTARLLAMALNCESSGADACGECGPCRKIIRGTHPDIVELTPEKDFITIGQVRELQASMAYRPYEGRFRVISVAPAEAMNANAQNALLKTLEEPPQGNVLILICASPQRLLRTIQSRCQRMVFGLLPRPVIVRLLCEQGVEPQRAELLARLAEGSLGRAQALAQGELQLQRERIAVALEALSEGGTHGIWEFAEQLAQGDIDELDESLELTKTWLRDALLIRSGAGSERLLNIDRLELLDSLARRFDEQALLAGIEAGSQLQARLRFYPNRRLALWNLGLALTSPPTGTLEG
ncbi:MAG: DNA polymerase III subunit delta' [Candidatus Alcyoniella australis]|nr:DNA polymerase III subunit delta' [Candidatus Alcyoniella australis]